MGFEVTIDEENAMSDQKTNKMMQDGVSRRSVLGIGSAALAAAAFRGLSAHAQTREGAQKAEGDHSTSSELDGRSKKSNLHRQRIEWFASAPSTLPDIPPEVQSVLAPEMKRGEIHRGFPFGSCGEWDCGIHNPCQIYGTHHYPGANCF